MKRRPRLLDLFCGAGGASFGYHQAGFDVTGIDLHPQKNYPFPFIRADALLPPLDLTSFDAIHASPPCQAFSRATAWRGSRASHPDLLLPVRDLLLASGRPYIIENVQEARHLLLEPVLLCGSHFNLPFRRHRFFEAPSLPFFLSTPCQHRPSSDLSHDHGSKQTESAYRDALQVPWMTAVQARQAIPPAYTRFLGKLLLQNL